MIKDGGFNAEVLIIDGLDFSKLGDGYIAAIKSFAVEMGVSAWLSCNVKGEEPFYDQRNVPLVIKDSAGLFEVIIILDPKPDHIALTVSRDRDVYNPENLALKLDPKTLLILEN